MQAHVNRYQVAAVNRMTGDDLQTLPVRDKAEAERAFKRAEALSQQNPLIGFEIRTLH